MSLVSTCQTDEQDFHPLVYRNSVCFAAAGTVGCCVLMTLNQSGISMDSIFFVKVQFVLRCLSPSLFGMSPRLVGWCACFCARWTPRQRGLMCNNTLWDQTEIVNSSPPGHARARAHKQYCQNRKWCEAWVFGCQSVLKLGNSAVLRPDATRFLCARAQLVNLVAVPKLNLWKLHIFGGFFFFFFFYRILELWMKRTGDTQKHCHHSVLSLFKKKKTAPKKYFALWLI